MLPRPVTAHLDPVLIGGVCRRIAVSSSEDRSSLGIPQAGEPRGASRPEHGRDMVVGEAALDVDAALERHLRRQLLQHSRERLDPLRRPARLAGERGAPYSAALRVALAQQDCLWQATVRHPRHVHATTTYTQPSCSQVLQ